MPQSQWKVTFQNSQRAKKAILRGSDHVLTHNLEFCLSGPVKHQQTTKILTKFELQRIKKALPTRFLLVIQRTKFNPGKLKKTTRKITCYFTCIILQPVNDDVH